MFHWYLFPKLRNFSLLIAIFLSSYCLSSASLAESRSIEGHDQFYLDKTQLVEQQIDSLKQRLNQADQEYAYLQHQQEKGFSSFSDDQKNKFWLSKTNLRIALVKSNLEGITLELNDSQQALSWLEKNIQEVENQLNALKIFGLKLIQGDWHQSQGLRTELTDLEKIRGLEKQRNVNLQQLQKTEIQMLQLYNQQYNQINSFLKSRKLILIKEKQVKSEIELQEQQKYWLHRLEQLYSELKTVNIRTNGVEYSRLENEIFQVNEKVNQVHLKTLLVRYQDQLRQLRFSLAHTNSINLLNNWGDQAQSLGKQVIKLDQLINNRLELIKKRGVVVLHEKQANSQKLNALIKQSVTANSIQAEQKMLSGDPAFLELENVYEQLHQHTLHLDKRLSDFRLALDRAIQQELSARQGLPGFSTRAWLDLGKETLLVPTLSFQLIKGFSLSFGGALKNLSVVQWVILLVLEVAGIFAFGYARKHWVQILGRIPEHDQVISNIKHLLASLFSANMLPLAFMGNIWLLFYFLKIPLDQYTWLIDMAWLWLLFRVLSNVARSALVETVHDDQGYDMQLYLRLKVIFIIGLILSSLAIFLNHLPLIYELRDLFDRLFLLMLLILSLLILRFWRVIPHLVLQYVDRRRTYLRRMIYFLGVFIPILLFINSLIGLFGFVNLVGMITWYEGVFTLVFIMYFFTRVFLSDAMERLSNLMIRHVNNGWLWTEAFLKPMHKVLRVTLFFGAWVVLFLFYGWNPQSPVVERLNRLMHYPLFDVLNTTIQPINIMEVIFAISLFYWAAGWTREFVYRMLLSKTKDMGIRNSMAILSQYAVVILGALLCLRLLGIDLHALFLVASGLLIAISFGLRDLVNNFACGLILLFERPIRVGDIVVINEQEGKVTHIGGRAVTVQTWDHMEIIVPNAELYNKSFINWTVHDDIVRTVITIKIDRQDNPVNVQEIILAVLRDKTTVLRDPAPEIFLKDMMDNHSEFEIRYYVNVRQVISRVAVRSEVLFGLWEAFDKHKIKVPHLQSEIFIKGQPLLLPEPSV